MENVGKGAPEKFNSVIENKVEQEVGGTHLIFAAVII